MPFWRLQLWPVFMVFDILIQTEILTAERCGRLTMNSPDPSTPDGSVFVLNFIRLFVFRCRASSDVEVYAEVYTQ